jgi:hypothetical protein
MKGGIGLRPSNTIDDSSEQTHDEQNTEVTNNVEVHLPSDTSALAGGYASIHHNLGVVSRINDYTNNPFGVPEVAAT